MKKRYNAEYMVAKLRQVGMDDVTGPDDGGFRFLTDHGGSVTVSRWSL